MILAAGKQINLKTKGNLEMVITHMNASNQLAW